MWRHRSLTPLGPMPCSPLNFNHNLLRQGTGTADHPTLSRLFWVHRPSPKRDTASFKFEFLKIDFFLFLGDELWKPERTKSWKWEPVGRLESLGAIYRLFKCGKSTRNQLEKEIKEALVVIFSSLPEMVTKGTSIIRADILFSKETLLFSKHGLFFFLRGKRQTK